MPKGPFSKMKGVPTAEQEALQEPTIDPVFLAAGGIAGGMDNLITEQARRAAVMDFLGNRVPFMDSAKQMFREIPYSGIKHFAQGFGDDVRGGLFTQLLNSQILPSHPLAGKVGALPAGQYPTGVFNRILEFARESAGRIKGLPE